MNRTVAFFEVDTLDLPEVEME